MQSALPKRNADSLSTGRRQHSWPGYVFGGLPGGRAAASVLRANAVLFGCAKPRGDKQRHGGHFTSRKRSRWLDSPLVECSDGCRRCPRQLPPPESWAVIFHSHADDIEGADEINRVWSHRQSCPRCAAPMGTTESIRPRCDRTKSPLDQGTVLGDLPLMLGCAITATDEPACAPTE